MYAVEREEASDTGGVGNHGKRLRRLEMPAESCSFRKLYARLLAARERLWRGRERAGPGAGGSEGSGLPALPARPVGPNVGLLQRPH